MSKRELAPIDPDELQPELDILDESNPHSLVNLLPGKMAESLKSISPEILGMTDTDLKRLGSIKLTEERLRHAFWMEYNFASLGKRRINMPNVYNGVCRKEYWWQIILTNKYKMAYIFLPPPNYRVQLSELLTVGLEQMRDILLADHMITDNHGNQMVDARLAGVKAKIVESLHNRVHGATVQKIQTENKTLNVGVTIDGTETLEDVDRKIREAEEKLGGRVVPVLSREVKEAVKVPLSKVRLNDVESAEDGDD